MIGEGNSLTSEQTDNLNRMDFIPSLAPSKISEINLQPAYEQGELALGDWWTAPPASRASFLRRHWFFGAFVVLPMAIASIYFFFIASDQFTSEARFIVRSTSGANSGGLTSLMQGQKLSRAADETYAVNEYMVSRDAVDALVKDANLRGVLSRDEADIFNRFPNFYERDNKEMLFKHFLRFVKVDVDEDSGISTLYVRAFRPDDAQALASALLRNGEVLVNKLNERAHIDALNYAKQLVDEAQSRLNDVQARLTSFRNEAKIVDPNKEAAASIDSLGKMGIELAQLDAEIGQQAAIMPNGPTISPLRERANAYKLEIDKLREKVVGSSQSMASKISTFDKIMLERILASKALEGAILHYENARQEAQQQQLYLQTIVDPNLPDQALYPKRFISLIFIFMLCFAVFWIVKAFATTVKEHQA